ncbi:GyrI-like domain-containing protein [Mucilaginibacter paludis]|nr:GyrI-like domain-containing protein [Mucilaginibacter paludis]
MESLNIIGIAVSTTNQNGQAAQDIGQLWGRFYGEDIPGKITNKAGDEVYSVYTDYESDYTGEYTTFIGFKVHSLDAVPEGLVGRTFEPQQFKKFTAKGTMPQAIVETWQQIWQNDETLHRSYRYDYELYGALSQNGENPEVDIFIGVN